MITALKTTGALAFFIFGMIIFMMVMEASMNIWISREEKKQMRFKTMLAISAASFFLGFWLLVSMAHV